MHRKISQIRKPIRKSNNFMNNESVITPICQILNNNNIFIPLEIIDQFVNWLVTDPISKKEIAKILVEAGFYTQLFIMQAISAWLVRNNKNNKFNDIIQQLNNTSPQCWDYGENILPNILKNKANDLKTILLKQEKDQNAIFVYINNHKTAQLIWNFFRLNVTCYPFYFPFVFEEDYFLPNIPDSKFDYIPKLNQGFHVNKDIFQNTIVHEHSNTGKTQEINYKNIIYKVYDFTHKLITELHMAVPIDEDYPCVIFLDISKLNSETQVINWNRLNPELLVRIQQGEIIDVK